MKKRAEHLKPGDCFTRDVPYDNVHLIVSNDLVTDYCCYFLVLVKGELRQMQFPKLHNLDILREGSFNHNELVKVISDNSQR